MLVNEWIDTFINVLMDGVLIDILMDNETEFEYPVYMYISQTGLILSSCRRQMRHDLIHVTAP